MDTQGSKSWGILSYKPIIVGQSYYPYRGDSVSLLATMGHARQPTYHLLCCQESQVDIIRILQLSTTDLKCSHITFKCWILTPAPWDSSHPIVPGTILCPFPIGFAHFWYWFLPLWSWNWEPPCLEPASAFPVSTWTSQGITPGFPLWH